MSRGPSDRELDRLLAGLPRAGASAGFANRVLADLDDSKRTWGPIRWLWVGATTVAALALAILLLSPKGPDPTVAEARALREEHRLLMEELESLKASLQESRSAPVLYLGGDENLDLVLDLGPVWQGEPTTDIRPAAYSGNERAMQPGMHRPGDRR